MIIDFQSIEDLIATNLNGVPRIAPDKHREVELALLNAIKTLSQSSINTLAQGKIIIGDITTTDFKHVQAISDVGTDQYYVFGSIQGVSTNFNNDNDVVWSWGKPTNISFEIYFREISANVQNINFWYMLIPKTF